MLLLFFFCIIIIIACIIIINFKTPKSRKCKCIVFFLGDEKESDYIVHVSSASFLCCLIIHIQTKKYINILIEIKINFNFLFYSMVFRCTIIFLCAQRILIVIEKRLLQDMKSKKILFYCPTPKTKTIYQNTSSSNSFLFLFLVYSSK